MKTLAFYLNGNYGLLLSRFPEYLSDINCIAFCQNKLAHDVARQSNSFTSETYLYSDFNSRYANYKDTDLDWLLYKYPDINLQQIYEADKSHYKSLKKTRVSRLIAIMSQVFHDWITLYEPDSIFFPIIESLDSMLLYQMCRCVGINTMVYTECRIIPRSFISSTCYEDLPIRPPTSLKMDEQVNIFLDRIKDRLSNSRSLVSLDDFTPDFTANLPRFVPLYKRILSQISRKLFVERHNLLISPWIKFQVNLHSIFDYIAAFRYNLIETYICKPLSTLPKTFDYFPLHFSPESSINTPAPYYINQLRVIDKILLDRNDSVPLVIKEHPAMRRNRPISFYLEAKKRYNVYFIPMSFNSTEIITKSRCVYSVTGSACIEAFALGQKWKQFGSNLLSSWSSIDYPNYVSSQFPDFVSFLTSISHHYLIRSPSNFPSPLNYILFSHTNIVNACKSISMNLSLRNAL